MNENPTKGRVFFSRKNTMMKIRTILLPLLYLLLTSTVLPLSADAQDTEPLKDPHDIIRKIASGAFLPVSAQPSMPFSIDAPADWIFKNTAPGVYDFKVPYHAGILGTVRQTAPSAETMSEMIKHWAQSRGIMIESEIQPNKHGDRFTAMARVGGEIWTLLAYGNSETGFFFIAQSPERWFRTYQPIFEQIISSYRTQLSPSAAHTAHMPIPGRPSAE